MAGLFKKWFTPKCPVCQKPLAADREPDCHVKKCPDGHYREESYYTLGVRVTYHYNSNQQQE